MILPELINYLEIKYPQLPDNIVDFLQELLHHNPDIPEEMVHEIGMNFAVMRERFVEQMEGKDPLDAHKLAVEFSRKMQRFIHTLSIKYNL